MLLSTKDGIRCDRCGAVHKDDFIYYSYDFHELRVRNNIIPIINLNAPPTFSVDICGRCMEAVAELVKKNYKPTSMGPGRRCKGGVHCDISGNRQTGTFLIYYCHIIKVQVHTSGLSVSCDSCKTAIADVEQPCPKCNQTQFSRSAETALDRRWLELYIDEPTHEEFKKRAITLRTTEAAQWSTSSE